MNFKVVSLFIIVSAYILSCSSNQSEGDISNSEKSYVSKNYSNDEDVEEENNEQEIEEVPNDEFNAEEDIYPDGKYVADVEYYNSKTGTESFYSLDVKVRNGKVVEIQFDNGGWLDDSHFYPERLRRGKARFTDDTDRDWEVKLKRFKY